MRRFSNTLFDSLQTMAPKVAKLTGLKTAVSKRGTHYKANGQVASGLDPMWRYQPPDDPSNGSR